MTGILPSAVSGFIAENHYGRISETAGLLAVGLLIALMVEKELLWAGDDGLKTTFLGWLNAAIIPLLLVFALIVVLRFAELLN